MPVKRRVSKGKLGFNYAVAVHLACGNCYLAGEGNGCGCELIDVNGVYRADLARLFKREYAAEISAVEGGAREPEIRTMLA